MKKLSKKEKRQQRQQAKKEKEDRKKIKIDQTLGQYVKEPRIAETPSLELRPKLSPTVNISSNKEPHIAQNPETEIFSYRMTWCNSHSDIVGSWSWNEPRGWTEKEWEDVISPNLNNMSNLTWQNIICEHKVPARGGKHVPKHHHQEVSTLTKEAQDRWRELDLEQFDTAFRFRFDGTTRAWGIQLRQHFFLIWWERYHKIYPVSK